MIKIAILAIALLLGFIVGKLHSLFTAKKKQKAFIRKSKSVTSGLVFEQISPFLPSFPCDFCDVRFVGKPIDFVGFKGLNKNNLVDEVLFIEVKTGKSCLTQREKSVKEAVEHGRVRYVEYRI